MAYTITNSNGSTLLILADNAVDNVSTSVTLIGKNVSSYGSYINNNFVRLLENFANDAGSPPRTPLKGQLWYDTTAKRLKIYDGSFKTIGGAIVSSSQPPDLANGDIWFDSTNNQLSVYNNRETFLVGPIFPKSAGVNGWNLPYTSIKNSDEDLQKVLILQCFGDPVGFLSTSSFELSSNDALTYFNTTTSTLIVSGLTIEGDIHYTGKTNNKYYSLTVDLDEMVPSNNNIFDPTQFTIQTSAIIDLLNAVYPINTTTNVNITNPRNILSIEQGILSNSEARVVCKYSVPSPGGYQIRRFYSDPKKGRWDYSVIVTGDITATNVIATIPKV